MSDFGEQLSGPVPAYRSGRLKDALSVLFIFALGVYFVVQGRFYPMGTARSMGPGFYPVILGIVAIVISLLILASAFRRPSGPIAPIAWRPLFATAGAILAFIGGMHVLGLLAGVSLSVLVAAMGDPNSKPLSTILLAVGLSLASWLVFVLALGLPIPLLKL